MTKEKYTIFVNSDVVFKTESKKDADLVLNSFQKIQELTYGLNGYIFDVKIMLSQETTPNYSRRAGYLRDENGYK